MPLTDVRSSLSPLIKQVQRTKLPVGITVHGQVEAYLVARETMSELEDGRPTGSRRSPRGSLELVEDLEAGREKIRAALRAHAAKLARELKR